LRAYRDGSVCMVNPLRSYLVGTKSLLALLHDEDNRAELDPNERALVARVVPPTIRQRGRTPSASDRHSWVLKKSESYGGHDVAIGPLVDEADWNRALDAAATEAWVRQRLEPIPR